MAVPIALTIFVALLDSSSLLCTASPATATVAFDHATTSPEDEISVDREKAGLVGPVTEGLRSNDLPASVLEGVWGIDTSRNPQLLLVDGNIDNHSSREWASRARRRRWRRKLCDDSQGTITAATRRQKENHPHHHQQQPLSAAKGRFRELKSASARILPSVHTIDEPASEHTGNVRGSLTGGGSKMEKFSAPGNSSSRCFEDPSAVDRCQANIFFFGVSKCGEHCCCQRCVYPLS